MARTMPTVRRKAGYTDAGASTPGPTASQKMLLNKYEAEDRSKILKQRAAVVARKSMSQEKANGGNPTGPFHRLLNALEGK